MGVIGSINAIVSRVLRNRQTNQGALTQMVGIRELKNRLSHYIDRVRRGEISWSRTEVSPWPGSSRSVFPTTSPSSWPKGR
jgi:hypothetical protein